MRVTYEAMTDFLCTFVPLIPPRALQVGIVSHWDGIFKARVTTLAQGHSAGEWQGPRLKDLTSTSFLSSLNHGSCKAWRFLILSFFFFNAYLNSCWKRVLWCLRITDTDTKSRCILLTKDNFYTNHQKWLMQMQGSRYLLSQVRALSFPQEATLWGWNQRSRSQSVTGGESSARWHWPHAVLGVGEFVQCVKLTCHVVTDQKGKGKKKKSQLKNALWRQWKRSQNDIKCTRQVKS